MAKKAKVHWLPKSLTKNHRPSILCATRNPEALTTHVKAQVTCGNCIRYLYAWAKRKRKEEKLCL